MKAGRKRRRQKRKMEEVRRGEEEKCREETGQSKGEDNPITGHEAPDVE
jgi:hypothetical protein